MHRWIADATKKQLLRWLHCEVAVHLLVPAAVIESELQLRLPTTCFLRTDGVQCSTKSQIKLLLCDARHQLLGKNYRKVLDPVEYMLLQNA